MAVSSRLRRTLTVLTLLGFGPHPAFLARTEPQALGQALDNSDSQKFHPQADLVAVVKAVEQDPQNLRAERDAEAAVQDGLPDGIETPWLPHLPVDTSPLPSALGILVVPKAYLPTPATEPQHDWSFSRITYVYVPIGSAGANRLLCRLHYTQVGDARLASRMGGLLALTHRTLTDRMGQEAEGGATPFDVWLCRSDQSGGEQWHGNIYFYDLDTPRSSIEWIREIAHEYSHLALPAIGGYDAPEYWANGYYGERLLIRWVARTPGGPALMEKVWGDFSGWPNFQRKLIAPALALYKKSGPRSTQAKRTDERGMRYLIGQILAFDDKYGGKRLASAFSFLPHAREACGPDFGAATAMSLVAQARDHP